MPPLISEEKMYAMYSCDESDDEPMYTEILEYICDGSKSRPSVNRRESRYKIHNPITQSQAEWKGALLSTQNMGKGLHKLFKSVVMRFFKFYQFWVNLDQKFPITFQSPEALQK